LANLYKPDSSEGTVASVRALSSPSLAHLSKGPKLTRQGHIVNFNVFV